jgi:hypothetical protein
MDDESRGHGDTARNTDQDTALDDEGSGIPRNCHLHAIVASEIVKMRGVNALPFTRDRLTVRVGWCTRRQQ